MSAREIVWGHDALELVFAFDDDHPVHVRHFGAPGGAAPLSGDADLEVAGSSVNQPLQPQPLVEILATDSGHLRAAGRLVHTVVGSRLRLRSHRVGVDQRGWSTLELVQADPDSGLVAIVSFGAPPGVAGVQAQLRLELEGPGSLNVESLALALILGIPSDGLDAVDVVHAQNDWLAESRWRREPLRAAGLPEIDLQVHHADPKGAFVRSSTGTWSTGSAAPNAFVVDTATDVAWGWQVETNGAWRWELGERRDGLYLALSGPTDRDHQWNATLTADCTIEAVPVSIVQSPHGFERAVDEMTAYRRAARRDHIDNRELPVVFNDYMNTLMGDPTTERLLPLIDAAAVAGCEVFVIDAGWYDDSGDWWDSVGEWMPSTVRFPGGFDEVLTRIRERGMMPGVWLEPEVIGVRSPMVDRLPDSAFLQRRGVRVREHDRFHLDLRDPATRAHLDAVVDRLVLELGVGYIKLDYNIDAGAGTDRDADSVGAGLLGHNRAHLDWLDGVLDRHPHLMLENCASGAMRQDFAMLSRLQVQSTSDQQDPARYPPIAAAAPLSMVPEQAANWAYPQPGMAPEEASFTLVTSMLGRFYLSGYLNRMSDPERALVAEAVAVHRTLRDHVRLGNARWPLGLPGWDDPWIALGIENGDELLLSVWRRAGDSACELALPEFAGREVTVEAIFPRSLPGWSTSWDSSRAVLTVEATAECSARTFRMTAR